MPASKHRRKPGKRTSQPRVLNPSQIQALHGPVRDAMIAMRLGAGNDDTWGTLTASVGLAIEVAKRRNQPELLPYLERANEALGAIHERHETTGGRWNGTPEELECIDHATEIARALHQVANSRIMNKAIAAVAGLPIDELRRRTGT